MVQEILGLRGVSAKYTIIISSPSLILQTREQCKLGSAVLSRQALTSSEAFHKYEYSLS